MLVRKRLRVLLLLMIVSVGAVGIVQAAINDPKRHAMCYDKDGKYDPQVRDCDPNSCGCLFHQLEEFIKGLFK
ncbi:MAG: hypothetical protein KF881_02080 [Acidobacteria bacterium]|nr:hypothetical protein [Acidobacteriota bacterium]